ncbi:MAG: hypothetical protein CMN29_14005 [Sandaracinus sp.]|nr:hypothetical protein [Myxococcales bacterium]MAT26053.1 hypothetical protein [Sandaracinus sp.]
MVWVKARDFDGLGKPHCDPPAPMAIIPAPRSPARGGRGAEMATKKKTSSKKSTTAKSDGKPKFEPQAHPDAKLTKKQVKTLYEKLLVERDRVMQGQKEHLSDAISNIDPLSDEMDVAQRHTEQAYLMRFADKERKLLVQIQNALEKFEEGDYGVCEGTGEPISYKRLELRPWTRYSVEYKEQVERERKQHHR